MRLGRTTAAAVVGMAVLAGCSDAGTANETLPPITPSAAPTSEALQPLGPADFPVPPEARAKTADGAKAFVNYYITLMSRAQADLLPEGLRDLGRDCSSCIQFADGVEGYVQQNYKPRGGGIRVDGLSEPAIVNNRAEFSVALTQLAIEVIGPDGEVLAEQSSAETAYPASGVAATWDEQRTSWMMADLTIQ
jgi:hypothetical protein